MKSFPERKILSWYILSDSKTTNEQIKMQIKLIRIEIKQFRWRALGFQKVIFSTLQQVVSLVLEREEGLKKPPDKPSMKLVIIQESLWHV